MDTTVRSLYILLLKYDGKVEHIEVLPNFFNIRIIRPEHLVDIDSPCPYVNSHRFHIIFAFEKVGL